MIIPGSVTIPKNVKIGAQDEVGRVVLLCVKTPTSEPIIYNPLWTEMN